jgi:hypothetical protein
MLFISSPGRSGFASVLLLLLLLLLHRRDYSMRGIGGRKVRTTSAEGIVRHSRRQVGMLDRYTDMGTFSTPWLNERVGQSVDSGIRLTSASDKLRHKRHLDAVNPLKVRKCPALHCADTRHKFRVTDSTCEGTFSNSSHRIVSLSWSTSKIGSDLPVFHHLLKDLPLASRSRPHKASCRHSKSPFYQG